MIKGKTAAALVGMAAMMGIGAPINASNQTAQQVQQRVSDQQQPVKETTTVRKQNKFSGFTPGYEYIPPGIPPKIYGMYHVRKGTHKRSNR